MDTDFQVLQILTEKAKMKKQGKELREILRNAKLDPYSEQGLRDIKKCRKVHFGKPHRELDRGSGDLLQTFIYYTKYPPNFYFTRTKTGTSKPVLRSYMIDDTRYMDLEHERGYIFAIPMCDIANAGKVEDKFELTPRRGGAYWPGFTSNLLITFYDVNLPDKIWERITDEVKRRPMKMELDKIKEGRRKERQHRNEERQRKREEKQRKEEQRQREYNEIK